MATFNDYIDLRAKELKDGLTHFMRIHSGIVPRNAEEVFSPSPEGDRYYADLDAVGRKMQAYLAECYERFYSTIAPMLEGQPEEVLSRMQKSRVRITRAIGHNLTFCNSSLEVLEIALAALDDQVSIMKEIHREINPEG